MTFNWVNFVCTNFFEKRCSFCRFGLMVSKTPKENNRVSNNIAQHRVGVGEHQFEIFFFNCKFFYVYRFLFAFQFIYFTYIFSLSDSYWETALDAELQIELNLEEKLTEFEKEDCETISVIIWLSWRCVCVCDCLTWVGYWPRARSDFSF